jgi:predicted O-methyltransferase YrrM
MELLNIILKYIRHFFLARNTRGFGVHSPFMYQFINGVLGEKHYFYIFSKIEDQRKELLKDTTIISLTDFGTGENRNAAVNEIAKKALKSAKYGQLLFRMVHYFKAVNVLELGTSLGITTSYLASSSSGIKCKSLEGCPQIASKAESTFRKLGLNNIDLVVGNIDTTLESCLKNTDKLDMVFFDANHKSEAVLNYFKMCLQKTHNKTIMVFDDIYWSDDMEKAWKVIQSHPRVTSTVDIFQIGIVFFNPNLHKKHYKLLY